MTEHNDVPAFRPETRVGFRQVADDMPFAIVEVDMGFNLVFANKAALQILGINQSHIESGLSIDTIIAPEQVNPSKKGLQALVNGAEPNPMILKIKRLDGAEISTETFSELIVDDGEPIGFVVYSIDMTRRISIEEKLRHQEGPFHLLVEQSNFVGMLVINDRFELEYVNNRCCDIVGRTRSELLGSDLTAILHPDSVAFVRDHYTRRQKGEEVPTVYEFKIIHPDGKSRDLKISSSVLRVSDGSLKTVGQFIDITEEKTNQQALKESEQKHRTLVETIDSGLIIDDENGIALMVNQPLCLMLGYDDPDDMVGMSILSWIDGWTEDDVQDKLQDRRNGKSEHYELNLVHKSGMLVPVLIHASPWYSPSGEYVGSIAIITDVSDLKQTEAEVRFLLDLLMHDIGNQLQLILAGVDLLGSDIPPEQKPNALRYVIDGANRCLELITNIRRAEESKSEPLRHTDAITILKSQIHLFGKQYDVTPEVTELPSDALINADSALSHLFWNIMENSIKHNPEPEKQVWISGEVLTHDILVLRFADNGPGLAFKKKQSLFDPSRRSRGVGIHLVRRLATKYNASLSVGDRISGEPEKGLEISIKFPLIVRKP